MLTQFVFTSSQLLSVREVSEGCCVWAGGGGGPPHACLTLTVWIKSGKWFGRCNTETLGKERVIKKLRRNLIVVGTGPTEHKHRSFKRKMEAWLLSLTKHWKHPLELSVRCKTICWRTKLIMLP